MRELSIPFTEQRVSTVNDLAFAVSIYLFLFPVLAFGLVAAEPWITRSLPHAVVVLASAVISHWFIIVVLVAAALWHSTGIYGRALEITKEPGLVAGPVLGEAAAQMFDAGWADKPETRICASHVSCTENRSRHGILRAGENMPCLTCLELNSSLEVVSKPDTANGLSAAGERNRAQQKQEKKNRLEALLAKHQAVCLERLKVEG